MGKIIDIAVTPYYFLFVSQYRHDEQGEEEKEQAEKKKLAEESLKRLASLGVETE